MAHVSAWVSTLPGSMHKLPEGTTCDRHPERLAVVRIQGETDSFGAEFIDCCAECRDEIANYKDVGRCDYCKGENLELIPHRDYDEGSYGPVYRICRACKKHSNDEYRELDSEYDDYFDDGE
jgi:hypothetical protein